MRDNSVQSEKNPVNQTIEDMSLKNIRNKKTVMIIGLLQLTITWYKSAMLEGKLIIIPALGHQNKGKSSFTGSGLFVFMYQCGNNNELAPQHGGFCTT